MRLSRLVVSLVVLLSVVVAVDTVRPAQSEATTPRSARVYYLNAISGCSDSGSGTIAQPWCTFAPVNASTFAAGSSILLARDSMFQGPLKPEGSGTSWTNPIYIGAYGSGAKPVIYGSDSAADRGIVLVDQDYIGIDSIEIAHVAFGVIADYTTKGHRGLKISNVYAHDISGVMHWTPRQTDFPNLYNSAAITIGTSMPPPMTSTEWLVRDIVIDGLKTRNSGQLYVTNPTEPYTAFPNNPPTTVRDITVSNGDFANIPLPGVAMAGVSNVRFVNNMFDCSGHVDEHTGTTCFYIWKTAHVTIQNNQFCCMNHHDPGDDESEIDVEGQNDDVRIVGNLFHDTAGGAIEFLTPGFGAPYGLPSISAEVAGNTFYNNANAPGFGHASRSLWAFNDTEPWRSTVTLSNNLYREGNGLLTTRAWASDAGYDASAFFPSTDNRRIAFDGDISSAPRDFAGPGVSANWAYRYWDGSDRAAAWNANTSSWVFTDSLNGSVSTGRIGRYTMTPVDNANKLTVRMWVAPRSGSVAVTGMLAKVAAGGDGLNWGITKNGTWLTPYNFLDGADVAGQLTSLTTSVNAGDKIGFVINSASSSNSTSDEVTWAPSVTYLPASVVADSSGAFAFGSVAVGTQSAVRTATITNQGPADAVISTMTGAEGPVFQTAGGTCTTDLTLAPSQSCTVTLTATPAVAGSTTGTFRMTFKDGLADVVVPESVTGMQVLSVAGSLMFGSVPVGTTSSTRTVTISNPGPGSVAATGITGLGGVFAQAPGTSCVVGATLPAFGSCAFVVTATPNQVGLISGSLTITFSGAPAVVIAESVFGIGAPLQVSSGDLVFGNVGVGTQSFPTHLVTITNPNSQPATPSQISLSGPFVRSGEHPGTCAVNQPIAANGGSCTYGVVAAPPSAGQFTGSLDLTFAGGIQPPLSVPASVTGRTANLTLTPASGLNFGVVPINTTSASLTFSVTNTSPYSVTVRQLTWWSTQLWMTGGTCAPGKVLAASGGSCWASFTYTSDTAAMVSTPMELTFYDAQTVVIPIIANTVSVDDAAAAIAYSSGFAISTGLSSMTWWNGTAHSSTTANATATYTCTSCTQLGWWSTKGPDRGKATVSVDNNVVATIDAYGPTLTTSSALYLSPALAPGAHTIKITVTNTKTAASTNTWVEIDRFGYR